MSSELTAKQATILSFIEDYIEENQMPPSLREIGNHFDLSVGTIQDQVEALRKKGFLEKQGTKARGLKLPSAAQEIPILGRVFAGTMHTAFENVEGHLPVAAGLSASRHFALKVRGDSMIDAGILEGDLVIVHMQELAEVGDIVVARLDDETTVKTLARQDGEYVLEPANPNYQTIRGVPFQIIGVVVEVRRQIKRWRQ